MSETDPWAKVDEDHEGKCWMDDVKVARAAEAAQHQQEMKRQTDDFNGLCDTIQSLRARLAAVEAERDHARKCEANHMMADHERIEALKVERDRLKAALSQITALDFEKFNGRHNFYSGAAMFVKAWLLAYAALTPQGQSTDGETK